MKKVKKFVSLLMALLMTISAVYPVAAVPAAAPQEEEAAVQAVSETETAQTMELVASYDMSASDGKLTDVTGNGFDAVYTGFAEEDFVDEAGDAVLTFDGSDKYVSLPAGMITSETFAIEATFQTETAGNGWLWTLGTKENVWPNVSNYLFMAPKFDTDGVIRAGIKDSSDEHLFQNAGSVSSTEYVTVRIEFDHGELALYVDDELRSTLSTDYSIQDILAMGADEDFCGYIGKSLYTPDPNFTGKLTQFDVYAPMNLVASYDMSSADGKLVDTTGNGFDAAYTGFADEDFTVEDSDTVLNFDGSGNYISLPAGMIESETFAIEATFQTDTLNGGWLWTLGTRENVWPNVVNYLFMSPMFGNDGTIRAGIKDSATEHLFQNAGAVSGTDYVSVRIEFRGGKLDLYVDGELRSSLDTGYSIQEILENGTDDGICGYIGRSLYTPDPEFTGKLTQFDVYALPAAPQVPQTDAGKVQADWAALEIPNADDVRGNITLPDTGANGSAISWASDDAEGIVTLTATDEGKKAPGVVTRPETDTQVHLTATLTLGAETRTKDFTLTVKAAPEEIELTDYIFATFLGDGGPAQQQVCFSVSRDGNHWKDMNDNQPILSVADATEGDKGVRDPFLFRTPEGDKFYLIATDLCIGSGAGTHDWGSAQSKTLSSKYIRVWESYDLVHWSEPWLAEIGVPNSNFTWAPEAVWDEESGQFMVYWAAGGTPSDTDPTERHRTYYCMTRDFRTFSEPKYFSENMGGAQYNQYDQIDTSILYLGNNTYVRTSSSAPDIPIEVSENGLFGDWKRVTTLWDLGLGYCAAGGAFPGSTVVEGPELFAYNEDDWITNAEGEKVPTWGVIVDNYGGRGYISLATTDFLNTTPVDEEGTSWFTPDYDFDSLKRHGTIMPITAEEYRNFVLAYDTGANVEAMAAGVTVGTMPEVSTGLDDHTAVWSQMDGDAETGYTISSYIKRYTLQADGTQTATQLNSVPVSFTLNSLYTDVSITMDGESFVNGSAVDLTEDRTFVLTGEGETQTIVVKTPQLATNSVLPGQLSDPDIDYFDGKYWIFPTTDGFDGWSGTQFHAFSADSLEGPWKDEGVILETNKDAATTTNTVHGYEVPKSTWSVGSAWAPSIEKIDDHYYFFYCAKLPDGNSCIGVAVADDPTGPYVPQSEPLVQRVQGGVTVGQAIDPSVFTDDDGTHYLYYGNGTPAVAQFTVDASGKVTMVDGTYKTLDGLYNFRESVTVNKIGDTYHFLWSVDDTGSPNYSVYYGTSDSPYGPVDYHYPLCVKDESMGILGTAHQSAIVVDGAMYMAYHRFYTPLNFYTSGLGFHRETCINRVPIGENGLLLPFIPTMEGVSGDVLLVDGTVWNPEGGETEPVPAALYEEDFDDADYADGTELFNGAKVEDGTLVLGGGSDYMSLPAGLLNGTNEATISFDVKTETTIWNFFTFAIGQDNNKYFFVRVRDNEIYSAITQNSWSAEDGAAVPTDSMTGKWQTYTVSINDGRFMVYVDGELKAYQANARTTLEDLGPDAKIQFGKSFYDEPCFTGAYDNIKIWDTALSPEQVYEVVHGEPAPEQYTITVTQSEGGVIDPATTTVEAGQDQTFTITANEGYVLSDVLVDGESVGAVGTYTFEKVAADHTITAVFTPEETPVCTADAAIRVEAKRDDDGNAVFHVTLADAKNIAAVQVNYTAENVVSITGENGFTYVPAGGDKGIMVLCYDLEGASEGKTFTCDEETVIATITVSGAKPTVQLDNVKIAAYEGADGQPVYGEPVDLIQDTATFTGYDINGDGTVNLLDVVAAMKFYQVKKTDGEIWEEAQVADVNGDGEVNLSDLISIVVNFTK